MAFTKTTWVDSTTPITATQLNRMEDGIEDAYNHIISQTAGGTGTAITLTDIDYVQGFTVTFLASASNGGQATTINGKPFYKPNTTSPPVIIAGKAYSAWYKSASDCFFLRASATGNAAAGDVLATKTFSNDDDTDITGTLSLTGTAGVINVLTGKTFYSTDAKTKLTGTMADRGTVLITPSTVNQAILAGYHNGSGLVYGDADLVAGNIRSGYNIFNTAGTFVCERASGSWGQGYGLNDIYHQFTCPFTPTIVQGWIKLYYHYDTLMYYYWVDQFRQGGITFNSEWELIMDKVVVTYNGNTGSRVIDSEWNGYGQNYSSFVSWSGTTITINCNTSLTINYPSNGLYGITDCGYEAWKILA